MDASPQILQMVNASQVRISPLFSFVIKKNKKFLIFYIYIMMYTYVRFESKPEKLED